MTFLFSADELSSKGNASGSLGLMYPLLTKVARQARFDGWSSRMGE